MKSIWKIFFVSLSMSLLIGGCGGGGSSPGTTPSDPDPTTTTLTTTLAFGESQVESAGIRLAAVQTVTVTLTLSNGTEYEMLENGSGGYHVTVTDFPTDSPFVIEAKAGELMLKNFFDKLPGNGENVDLGDTDPKTTLFVDLLATFVGASDATAEQLLEAMKDTTLAIDTVALKSQVADDNDEVFQKVRQSYQAVLTREHFEAGAAPEALIDERNETFTTVKEGIESGEVAPPYLDPTSPLGFTDALLDGKTFQEGWWNDGIRSEENLTFTLNGGGQYTIAKTSWIYGAANNLIAIEEGEAMTGSIQADGTLRVEFPEVDPENGAAYAILTLLAETAGSISYQYVEYTAADEEVADGSGSWEKVNPVNIPGPFSTEWLSGKTFYIVYFGVGEGADGEELPGDVPVVGKVVFGNNGMAEWTGLRNSGSGTPTYDVTESGLLYMNGEAEGGSVIVCGSTSQYIKTHFLWQGEFDNVDLFFFDESAALAYADNLTEDIPACSEAQ